MSPFSQDKHDIGLLRTDGTTKVGFILAKDKNGVPLWQTWDDEYLAEQQTQEPGYGALPPEKELHIGQSDWRSGFGLETYDANDPKRYFSAYNFDLRFRGMGICGPKLGSATIPSSVINDADLEAWTGNTLDEWTKTGAAGTLTDETIIVQNGTHSAKIVSDGSAETYLYQAIESRLAKYKSVQFVFKAYVYASVASKVKIRIKDSVASTDSGYHTGGGGWEQLTATRTIDALATYVRLELVIETGTALTAYFDNTSIDKGISGVITDFCDFNDLLYMATGSLLTKLNSGGTAFTFVKAFPKDITSLKPFSDDKLYICQGYNDEYFEMDIAEVFIENTDANSDIKHLEMIALTANTMYGDKNAYTVQLTTDPKQAGTAWGTQKRVGNADKAITALVNYENALYIMKEEQPYYLDSSGYVKVLTDMTRSVATTTGGKNSLVWGERLYMPYGTEGLLEYDGTNFTWLNPSKYCTNLADFDGAVQALAGDEEWLFAAVDNATYVEILAGRYETIDGTTSWVWHPIAHLFSPDIEKMYVSNVVQKRLWISTVTSGTAPGYLPLPQGYGYIVGDANRSFQTSGYFITPWMHADFKGDSKSFIKITLMMGDTTANVYFEAHYQKKGDSVWTDIGDFKTSPTTSKFIPADATPTNPTSTAMRFKIVAKTNSTTSTPILYGYDVRAILYPSKRKIISCVVRCADDIQLNDETKERDNNAANIKTVLEEAKDATWPVTFYDIDAATTYVRFLPVKPFSRIVRDETSKNLERHFNLLLECVTLS